MFANYHTHTFRCRHATGTERAYIECAIARGVRVLGFSDHAPYLFPAGHYSSFRMTPDQLDEYCTTLCDLRREYQGQIELHIGLEMEYYPAHFFDTLEWMRDYPIEYLLLGQHFLGNEYDAPYSSAAHTESDLRRYADQTIAAVQTGCFTYFAHPDLIHYPANDEIYRSEMRRICECTKENRIPLELNLLGLSEHRAYPNAAFWPIAREVGCDVVVGCDAHRPDAVANPDHLRQANTYLGEMGLSPRTEVPLRNPFHDMAHQPERGTR